MGFFLVSLLQFLYSYEHCKHIQTKKVVEILDWETNLHLEYLTYV